MFSVLILTLNEEQNLPRCLATLGGCGDVVVLDSGSVDRTTEIARNAGARVFSRPFDTFAGQRNFAQREIPFRHKWVFHLDADEQLTPALIAECSAAAATADCDGFFVAPKMIFQGRWIRHSTDFPAFQARFVAAPGFSFIQVGHGQREAAAMRMNFLRETYLHNLTNEDEQEWRVKHERYAREEARDFLRSQDKPSLSSEANESLSRRRALKRFSYRLPFRSQLRFIYQYILRRGFLDGRAGLTYCRRLAQYEGMVGTELRRARAHMDR